MSDNIPTPTETWHNVRTYTYKLDPPEVVDCGMYKCLIDMVEVEVHVYSDEADLVTEMDIWGVKLKANGEVDGRCRRERYHYPHREWRSRFQADAFTRYAKP